MSPFPRRGLLAASLALPAAAQAPDPIPTDLDVVLAGESSEMITSLLEAFLPGLDTDLPLRRLRLETVPWVIADLPQQVRAGRPGAEVVLSNVAGFALGAARELWQELPAGLIAEISAQLTPAGRLVQESVGTRGLVLATLPGGPVLLHRRSILPSAPRNAAALMDYARQNPGRFQYARPGQSRFGQTFMTNLPYLLRDHSPKDPQAGWDRSWAYLLELGRHAGYYPSSGEAALEEFSEGGCELMPCLLSTYLLSKAAGLLPEDTLCSLFDDAPLMPHSLILAVPRGIPELRLPAVGRLASFFLRPEIQRVAFGRGLVPGHPAPEAADSPQADVHSWTEAMTPELAAALQTREIAPPLGPFELAYAVRRWDERIGARYGEGR